MEVSDIANTDFVVENVLQYLDTEELFACAEVNRLWQSIALSLLRKKLVSVSVCCVSEAEQALPEAMLGSVHVCVDIFCSKFLSFRNIARMAGMRPSLIFLSYHANLIEDPRVVECLRGLLPPDSVIIYFKLELVRSADESDDGTHEGIFGEFLFHADAILPAPATYEESCEERPPDSPGPSSSIQSNEPQIHADDEPPAPSLPGPASDEGSPPATPPLTWPRPRLPSGADGNGAVFHNVLPGVLMFQALHVTEASLEADSSTSCFTEEATHKSVQVTSAAIFNTMPTNRLIPFMRSLSENFGSTTNTIAVAFPRNQEEARQELEAFERVFPNVPALANQATEFNVDGQYAPHSRLKLILLLIKLLD
ncbi:hypothetical protein HPB49_003812 [Dermacentor silvarum]|uniref:Uncharacterized protein n=1 Tax=Dermacentor silvarum TaxID=543639 RepID=A0ACB8DTQ4_DERSI|nr:hypothetical protein HPB49_003812 [Dermacentor silvarum]